MKKKVLFVSHDATPTGAPIVLLHLLRWFKKNSDLQIHILLLAKGSLQTEFEAVAKTYLWKGNYKPSITERIKKRLNVGSQYNDEQVEILRQIAKINPDLIYLNTVVSTSIISALFSVVSCPFICHVHENEYTLSFYYPNALTAEIVKRVSHFIAVSESTKENLMRLTGIAAEKISICYEFVPTHLFSQPSLDREAVKKGLGLSNEFVVGGAGLPIWRKGIDLFLQVAVELKKRCGTLEIKMMWVGSIDHAFECAFNYEKERLGIEDMVILTGQQKIPQNYFQLFDVFALTSREDPFPLVCLEAASLAKPVFCFENSGGMVEFLKEEQELIVPYADVVEMAERIIRLKDDESKRTMLGRKMLKYVANYDVDVCAPIIHSTIKKFFTSPAKEAAFKKQNAGVTQ